jgi:hypothetical protein
VLRRTLTGNTVMYVCAPDGSVLDALPGVYTTDDFLKELRKTLAFLKGAGNRSSSDAARDWHRQQVTDAVNAERIRTTFGKVFVESPLLNALGLRVNPKESAGGKLQPLSPAQVARNPEAAFSAVSSRIEDMSKQPATADELVRKFTRLPEGERPTPEELGRRAVEMDSRTNIILVRPAVHLLLSTYQQPPGLNESRDAIYKRLLHVPIDDPNFGLAPALIPGSPLY